MAKRKGSKKGRKKGRSWGGKISAAKKYGRPYVLRVVKKRTGRIRSLKRDRKRSAMPPGWRVSKRGRVYYEARRNRSDLPGSKI